MHSGSGDPAVAGLHEASGTSIAPEKASGERLALRASRGRRGPAWWPWPSGTSVGLGWGLLGVFLVSTILSFVYYRAGWVSPTRTYSGDIGDPEQMMWFLGWVPFAIAHAHNPLLTNYALYPGGANVMWNTSIVFPSLVVSPVTLLFGPIASYNVLVTGAPILAASTAYLAFSRYVTSRLAAGVGAVAFGFSPFLMYQQLGHQQLSLLALVPIIFLLLDELLVRQQWRFWVTGLLLGFVTVCQLLTGEEMLTITVMMAVVAVVLLVVTNPRKALEKAPFALKGAAVALGVFVVLAGFPLYEQFRGPLRVHNVHPASLYFTDLAALIQPVGKLVSFQLVPDVATLHVEPTGYVGIPLILILMITLVLALRRRRPIALLGAAMIVIFTALAMGPRLTIDGRQLFSMPWGWLNLAHRTLIGNVLPGRLTVAVDLFAALLLAVFVDVLVGGRHKAWLRLSGALLVVLALVSWIPTASRPTTVNVPGFFTSSLKDRIPQGSVALVSPYVYGSFTETALVWQSASQMRFRMVDGWLIVPGPHSGPTTIASNTLLQLEKGPVSVTPGLRAELLSYLHSVSVDEIIVGPGPGKAQQDTFFTTLLGEGPLSTAGGVNVWRIP